MVSFIELTRVPKGTEFRLSPVGARELSRTNNFPEDRRLRAGAVLVYLGPDERIKDLGDFSTFGIRNQPGKLITVADKDDLFLSMREPSAATKSLLAKDFWPLGR